MNGILSDDNPLAKIGLNIRVNERRPEGEKESCSELDPDEPTSRKKEDIEDCSSYCYHFGILSKVFRSTSKKKARSSIKADLLKPKRDSKKYNKRKYRARSDDLMVENVLLLSCFGSDGTPLGDH